MESKLTDNDESSGGSGKSFMVNFLRHFKQIVTLNGRNKDLTGNRFFMDRVDEYTDLLNVDDAQKYLDFAQFYAVITGNMPIDRKTLKTLEIEFKKSPKLVISSNFPPPNVDSSTMRRLLLVVFSDYYHKQTKENGYLENRQISDDFGYPLHDENYKPEWWNEDFNFLVDCLQFYLKCNREDLVITAPMAGVNKRINIAEMGSVFMDWAMVYFSREGTNLNAYVNKTLALENFKNATKSGWTMNRFSKALKAFAEYNDEIWRMNPEEITDKSGRIIKRVQSHTIEFIYYQTYGEPIREYYE